eukprot:CAMPEP_0113314804 /NCGR_PEP_ID=MMETSP0010_2-20120614/10717_1 /TAXON_ID=216773 ORGANISM="Corethron hystrix, Strain 308" /NCGR_SAMPLE_ID=MMETSP0010_2 /ASSEMBLY_ACC=CAM_ASM_000155 /LENGTH=505 /DNA_ID=CAMNT_0000171161 /DNA_START=179 /DNA_END=1697 /DNA_ORIENTATION=- /assembly_acc=CAM_ASM_000155
MKKKQRKFHRGVTSSFDIAYSASLVHELLGLEEGSVPTHFPCVLLDTGGGQLPEAALMAKFLIVLTTNQRLSKEWKNGSFETELRHKDKLHQHLSWSKNDDMEVDDEASSLLKIHFLRLVVDEGHTMGKGPLGSAIQFAGWITAQRRWIVTGTPTPQTACDTGLSNIFQLLQFLKQNGSDGNVMQKDAIRISNLKKSWREGSYGAFFQMKSMLNLYMLRHSKECLKSLLRPKFSRKYLGMSDAEKLTYNTITSAVKGNIITCSMEGKTSGWQDSLLNLSNTSAAIEALRNIRLTCNGYCKVIPTLTDKNYIETVQYLENLKLQEVDILIVKAFLDAARVGKKSACMKCTHSFQLLNVLPCGHLLCIECINDTTYACPICQQVFDVDTFQKLQPGFNLNWEFNLLEKKSKKQARGRTTDAGNEQILPPPAPESGDVRAVADFAPAAAVRPVRRLRNNHQCQYPSIFTDGRCLLCNQFHMNAPSSTMMENVTSAAGLRRSVRRKKRN